MMNVFGQSMQNGSETKYEEWICRLSHRLISECKPHTKSKNDPQFSLTVFELLGPLMISDAGLAELVFALLFCMRSLARAVICRFLRIERCAIA